MASAASRQGPRRSAPAGRNVLERLLVECVQATRAVPSESGVRFHVNVPADAEGSVCLIFHVDLERHPLVTKGPRPDYLVLYGTREGVILTIVEMKGRGEQDLTTGRKRGGIGHAALAADRAQADIGVCPPGDALHDLLVAALERGLGLPRERRFLRLIEIPGAGSRV